MALFFQDVAAGTARPARRNGPVLGLRDPEPPLPWENSLEGIQPCSHTTRPPMRSRLTA